MKKLLLKLTKAIFADTRSAVIGLVVVSLFAGGTWYLYVKNALHLLRNTLQSPTQIWATIALVLLLVVYTFVKSQKQSSVHSEKDPFEDYYFSPPSGAWRHKTAPAVRACANCKVDGKFSMLTLTEDQKSFVCDHCGKSAPNIPKEIFPTPDSITLAIPIDSSGEFNGTVEFDGYRPLPVSCTAKQKKR